MKPQTAVNLTLALAVIFLAALLGYEKGQKSKVRACVIAKPTIVVVEPWDPKDGPHPACKGGLKIGPCV
jgi:hypothetical protein